MVVMVMVDEDDAVVDENDTMIDENVGDFVTSNEGWRRMRRESSDQRLSKGREERG